MSPMAGWFWTGVALLIMWQIPAWVYRLLLLWLPAIAIILILLVIFV